MSLRVRVALAGLATVGVVLLATGWWLSASLERDGRAEVDRQLAERARQVSPPSVTVALGTDDGPAGVPAQVAAIKAKMKVSTVEPSTKLAPPPGARLLEGSGVFTMISSADGAGKAAGDVPPGAKELTSTPGYSTRRLGAQTWRVLVTESADGTRATLGQSLEPVLARVATTRSLLLRLGLVALAATGLAGFAVGSVALRPLQRLRRRAEAIGVGDDAGGLSAGGPPEVSALGGALDRMLARLRDSAAQTEHALESTRRFAGDAGHELRTPLAGMSADIGVLQDHAGTLAPDARDAIASLAGQHRRLTALLNALQTLALGDARSALAFAPVDLADVAEQAVASARRRHPGREIALDVDIQRAVVHGWADGLRAIADNLLENALRHGGPQAAVLLAVRRSDGELQLCVDDGGPGVPADERELVFERFARGRGAAPGGSGLGLSVVAQQAALHGGRVTIGDAPGGGARFVVALPSPAGADAGTEAAAGAHARALQRVA